MGDLRITQCDRDGRAVLRRSGASTMGASLGCTPSKAPEPGADKSLVGQASDAQSAPLLNKFEYKGDDLPIGSLKEFELTLDASEDEQAKAEIVISWPLEEAPAEDSGESVG